MPCSALRYCAKTRDVGRTGVLEASRLELRTDIPVFNHYVQKLVVRVVR
jgi:hypothetical protein